MPPSLQRGLEFVLPSRSRESESVAEACRGAGASAVKGASTRVCGIPLLRTSIISQRANEHHAADDLDRAATVRNGVASDGCAAARHRGSKSLVTQTFHPGFGQGPPPGHL